MCDYFFDESHGVAYKIEPVMASQVAGGGSPGPGGILVHTDIKVTNVKKEKIRRTLSELYPENYDLDEAKRAFYDKTIAKFVSGARRISEEEYENIKARFEI